MYKNEIVALSKPLLNNLAPGCWVFRREENQRTQRKTNNKLNRHNYSTRPELTPGHIGVRQVLSPTPSLLHMDMQFTLSS